MSEQLGSLIVVSGPSGVGKSTVCKIVRGNLPDLEFSVSCTTRRPRPGEIHGREYYFISHEEFESRIADEAFVEYAGVFDNYYGTLKSEVIDRVKAGKDVFLDSYKDTETCRCNVCNEKHKKIIKSEQNKRAYKNRKFKIQ